MLFSSIPRLTSPALSTEIRQRLYTFSQSLRQPAIPPTFYNIAINTPEFSRFVLALPTSVLIGMTVLSLSPPNTMPLIFEKFIPYQIKTIAITSTFCAFSDLAMATMNSAKRKYSPFLIAYASLMGSSAVLSIEDVRTSYACSLGLLVLHAAPTVISVMPSWVRAWRILFLATSGVSVITARRRLDYLEKNWDELVFGQKM